MESLEIELVEEDYNRIKSRFQSQDNFLAANKIADEIAEHKNTLKTVFLFLISTFQGKLRNDKKTPLVFHSIYLTKLMYMCGERDIDSLLTVALHDVLEDTETSEEDLLDKSFMIGKRHIVRNLRFLEEDKSLSREPDGENLPPRYVAHVKKLIGAPREVINTELIDRFSDLMDLEYITDLPEDEKRLRLKSKVIKVKSFVYNIIRNRQDYNTTCLNVFEAKLKAIEEKWGINIDAPVIN